MKKIRLILTLALTTIVTTGCSLFDFISIEDADKEELPKISLAVSSKEIKVGDSYQIEASVDKEGANQKFIYSSDNLDVCDVNSSGLITGVALGTANIKVSWAENKEVSTNFVAEVVSEVSGYTVTFNANGGYGTMKAQKTDGSSFVVPGCSFTNAGYRFDKWALNSPLGEQIAVSTTIENIEDDFTLYALWIESSGTDEIDDNYGSYYDSIGNELSGTQLKNALNDLNNSKRIRTMGYAGLKDYGKYTEIDWTGKDNVNGKMFGFYDNALIADHWDNEATWNREHVWPKSLGGGTVEGDMYMPRPCSVKINSARGNKYYGSSGSMYDPGQYEANYRGVAARIIFYCAIANKNLDIIDETSGGSTQMGKLSDLLKWNLQYAPSRSADAHLTLRIEANRNKVMYSNSNLQGNRNPFVDHPEYACRIWGSRNATTKQICGLN